MVWEDIHLIHSIDEIPCSSAAPRRFLDIGVSRIKSCLIIAHLKTGSYHISHTSIPFTIHLSLNMSIDCKNTWSYQSNPHSRCETHRKILENDLSNHTYIHHVLESCMLSQYLSCYSQQIHSTNISHHRMKWHDKYTSLDSHLRARIFYCI